MITGILMGIGLLIAFLAGWLIEEKRMARRYEEIIDDCLAADTMIQNHIRDHVHRDGDMTWLNHAPRFMWFEFVQGDGGPRLVEELKRDLREL